MPGRWTLDSLESLPVTPMDDPFFGHNFSVLFRWRYQPPALGRVRPLGSLQLQETPSLQWEEEISMLESEQPNAPRTWRFATDMYQHNPASPSLKAWLLRYVLAYNHVAHGVGTKPGVHGSVKLFSLTGRPLQLRDLGGPQERAPEQARVVRDYITTHGCQMHIQLDDRPGLNINVAEAVEAAISLDAVPTGRPRQQQRLLSFNIGAMGSGPRVRAYQYLRADTTANPLEWYRDFGAHSPPPNLLNTAGVQQQPPPPGVAQPRARVFFETEGEFE